MIPVILFVGCSVLQYALINQAVREGRYVRIIATRIGGLYFRTSKELTTKRSEIIVDGLIKDFYLRMEIADKKLRRSTQS